MKKLFFAAAFAATGVVMVNAQQTETVATPQEQQQPVSDSTAVAQPVETTQGELTATESDTAQKAEALPTENNEQQPADKPRKKSKKKVD